MGLLNDLGRGPVALDSSIFIYFIEEHPRFLRLLDPVFAAIERHKEAWRAFDVACDMADGPLADEQGREVTEADEAAYEACNAAEQEAKAAFLATPPITVAGARAGIAHVGWYDDGVDPETVLAFTLGLLDSPLLAEGRA